MTNKHWWRAGSLYCKHGLILYGDSCVDCEGEATPFGRILEAAGFTQVSSEQLPVSGWAKAHRELVIDPMRRAFDCQGFYGMDLEAGVVVISGGYRSGGEIRRRQILLETMEQNPGAKVMVIGADAESRVTMEYDGDQIRVSVEPATGGMVEGLFSMSQIRDAPSLRASELAFAIQKMSNADFVEGPAPSDYLQHDPTKRVGRRRREKRKGQTLRSDRGAYGGGWS